MTNKTIVIPTASDHLWIVTDGSVKKNMVLVLRSMLQGTINHVWQGSSAPNFVSIRLIGYLVRLKL